jgi:transglutaminase-like putative cysteine protease
VSDVGIRAAIERLEALIRASTGSSIVRDWALRVAGDNSAYPTPASKARALLAAIRTRLRYPDGATRETIATCTDRLGRGDADDEAVALSTACAALGLETKLRLVQRDRMCSVAVDVRQGTDWVTFATGKR